MKTFQTQAGVVIPLEPQGIGAKINAALPETLGTDDRTAILLAAVWGEYTRTRPCTLQTKRALADLIGNVLTAIPVGE